MFACTSSILLQVKTRSPASMLCHATAIVGFKMQVDMQGPKSVMPPRIHQSRLEVQNLKSTISWTVHARERPIAMCSSMRSFINADSHMRHADKCL